MYKKVSDRGPTTRALWFFIKMVAGQKMQGVSSVTKCSLF